MLIHIYLITKKKQAMNLKKNKGGIQERSWREERKGRVMLLYYILIS